MKSCNRKGFTLIELLVVIAIIAILAAILFPVFAKAREKARQSSCQSNVKQIVLAFNMYSQDYDETYPTQMVNGAATTPIYDWQYKSTGSTTSWANSIVSYIKGNKLLTCPSAGDTPNQISYLANGRLLGQASASITKPADTILLMDGNSDSATAATAACPEAPAGSGILSGSSRLITTVANAPAGAEEYNTGTQGTGGIGNNPDAANVTSGYYALHSSGMMVGYADGHVKWIKWGNLATAVGHGTATIPNNPFLPNQN